MCFLEIKPMVSSFLGKTGSNQNCQLSEMDGAGHRISANRRHQEGPRRYPICGRTTERSMLAQVRKNGELILILVIQMIQAKYTLDLLNEDDEFHTDIIRSQLTRNIANTFKEVREELIMAMDDQIPTCGDREWQFLRRRRYISNSTQSGSRSPF